MGYEIKNLYRASYLERPENKSRERGVSLLEKVFSTIKIVLSIRIFFMLIDVLPTGLEKVIEAVSLPLVAPLYLIVDIAPKHGSIEWVAIFALVIYSIIGYISVRTMRSSIVSSPAEEYEN